MTDHTQQFHAALQGAQQAAQPQIVQIVDEAKLSELRAVNHDTLELLSQIKDWLKRAKKGTAILDVESFVVVDYSWMKQIVLTHRQGVWWIYRKFGPFTYREYGLDTVEGLCLLERVDIAHIIKATAELVVAKNYDMPAFFSKGWQQEPML